MIRQLLLALVIATLAGAEAAAARADFRAASPSLEARRMADWVVAAADNGSLSFVIIDKKNAEVFVFDDRGQLLGASPVLLGLAVGGDMPLSAIPRGERTTPAGRFVAFLGRAPGKPNTLWVDYKNAVSMHRVKGLAKDRRLQRLATPTPRDNRISFGCINVPVEFFERTVLPALKGARAVVYILPEIKPTRAFFSNYYVVE